MADYQKMYAKLFNTITDTIEKLKEAQQQVEEEYIKSSEKEQTLKIVEDRKNQGL